MALNEQAGDLDFPGGAGSVGPAPVKKRIKRAAHHNKMKRKTKKRA